MKYAPLSEKDIDAYWSKIARSPSIYSVLDGRSKEAFTQELLSSSLVLWFPFGIVRVSSLVEGQGCLIHGVFWSHKLFRSLNELEDTMSELAQKYMLKWIGAVIPKGSSSLAALLTSVGFRYVSTMPRYFRTDHCIDGVYYAKIFKEEEPHE